jgi:hypothetical protein
MTNALTADVPPAAHAKAIKALERFNSLVSQYEMLLDTQQALVRAANFSALFETASRGDRLARDADLCGRQFAPLIDAIASGQFTGPRATEIRKLGFAAKSNADTLGNASSRLAAACRNERDVLGREIRKAHSSGLQAGLPPAYRTRADRFLDRRV